MNTNSSHNILNVFFYSVCTSVCAHVYHERHVEICVCAHVLHGGHTEVRGQLLGGQLFPSTVASSSGHWACVHLLGYLSCHKNFLYKLRLRK